MKIAVVGAGVIGLSCATLIQKELEDVEVTIIADKFGKDTLSDGAAGLFRPFEVEFDVDKELYIDTFLHFTKLLSSTLSGQYGIQYVSGYLFSDYSSQIENIWYKDVVLNFNILKPYELQGLTCKRHGCFFTTIVTECRKYLPALMSEFLANNGKIIEKSVKTINELVNNNHGDSEETDDIFYDIVILCTGLRSATILDDPNLMVPVRGQIVRINAPWIKHFYYISDGENDFNTYIIPTTQSVVLGGSREIGQLDTTVNKVKSQEIIENCSRIVPSVTKADILTEWVGLRPYLKSTLKFSTPKISAQIFSSGEKMRKDFHETLLIHNYGHGGNGISMSYGSALRVLRLIQMHKATKR